MTSKKNNGTLLFLFLCIAGMFLIPYLSSCGKSGQATNVGLNTQLNILNLSPDVHPVNLYIDFIKQGVNTYTYPYPSGYFFLNSIDTPIQIRSALVSTVNLLSIDYALKANHKYSLFITGINADSALTYIFTADDTTAIPNVGFGKIRFINACVQSPALDLAANGTTAFTNVKYKAITNYIQLPAGNYNFQLNPTGVPGKLLPNTSVQNTTIQDGRLYTLYTYGVVDRVDSAAFGANVLTNR